MEQHNDKRCAESVFTKGYCVYIFISWFLAMVTLLPTSNIVYESSYNLLPLTNIDNYIYSIFTWGL